jgi:hypothetical protein
MEGKTVRRNEWLSFMIQTEIQFGLPSRVTQELSNWPIRIGSPKQQLDLAIRLSSVPYRSSLLHAENVALCLAQKAIGRFTCKTMNICVGW